MDFSPNTLKPWIDLIIVYGGTLVIFSAMLYFWLRYADFYFDLMVNRNGRKGIEKIREIHEDIDKEENERSRVQMRSIQKYLDEQAEYIFAQWVDRVNVWVNHNGTRAGKFHFIFYSLIAELVNTWVKWFGYSNIQPGRLPYYVFADYEEEISNRWFVFKHDYELKWTPLAIAKDFWTKTVYWLPLSSINGMKVSWIIFFTSVHHSMEEIPNIDNIANDVRALLI